MPSHENISPNGGGVAGNGGGVVFAGVPAHVLMAPAAFRTNGNGGIAPASANESNVGFGSKYAQLCAPAAAEIAVL